MLTASVVIPAHNEERTIGRNLVALRAGWSGHDLDVVVVCNGCTDQTAAAARRADPRARVIEIAQPSKVAAVRVGNSVTDVFPRVHLDADVVLTGSDLQALLEPLVAGQAMVAAPWRRVPRDGCSTWVDWYYDVWEELPRVRTGLFGRGAVAVAEEAQRRILALPPVMNDDLAMSDAFAAQERIVVTRSFVVVHPPKTIRDLVRRRVRVATGNSQARELGVGEGSGTSPATLARLVLARPALALRMPVFLGVTLVARLAARRAIRAGDFTTWQRDESSRS